MTTPENFSSGIFIADRYEVVDKVGMGGMGAVLKVRDRSLNNEVVALKVLHAHLITDPSVFARFRNEVLVARQLSHPNIVRMYDIGTTEEGQTFISMEYVEGKSLRQMLPNYSWKHFTELISLLRSIADVLAYAHRSGIIHRDLKPDNVLVKLDGSIKLTDFGLARALWMESNITPQGETMGTAHYMSPEQIRGETLDGRSDIYAWGIMAYELATGKRPFDDPSWYNVLTKHLSEVFPAFPEDSMLPKWYRDMIMTATAKTPEARFQNAEEIVALLDNYVAAPEHTRMSVERAVDLKKVQPRNIKNNKKTPELNKAQPMFGAALLSGIAVVLLAIGVGRFGFVRRSSDVVASPAKLPPQITRQIVHREKEVGPDFPEHSFSREEIGVQLVQALSHRDKHRVEELLNLDPELNVVDDNDSTPLFEAIRTGSTEIVKRLLDKGASIEFTNSLGTTPLIFAIKNRQQAMVIELINHKADVNKPDYSKTTPLMYATKLNMPYISKLLFEHGADPEATNAQGEKAGDFIPPVVKKFLNPEGQERPMPNRPFRKPNFERGPKQNTWRK